MDIKDAIEMHAKFPTHRNLQYFLIYWKAQPKKNVIMVVMVSSLAIQYLLEGITKKR